MSNIPQYSVVVPAAGVGKRMQADIPKQYLKITNKTLLEHTLENLIQHPNIARIVLVLHPQDPYFHELPIAHASWLTVVDGGLERSDSVLAGLKSLPASEDWVLVHDAARPCLRHEDLTRLLGIANESDIGGILASPVRDTMKRSNIEKMVLHTESRELLWHALTPQFFPLQQLRDALKQALLDKKNITDEASAIEYMGGKVRLIEGSQCNIKVTHPEDLPLAKFYLTNRVHS
jgi:2-C-methyl-D-erythritol 4-phosphate cytidylyltransferase